MELYLSKKTSYKKVVNYKCEDRDVLYSKNQRLENNHFLRRRDEVSYSNPTPFYAFFEIFKKF